MSPSLTTNDYYTALYRIWLYYPYTPLTQQDTFNDNCQQKYAYHFPHLLYLDCNKNVESCWISRFWTAFFGLPTPKGNVRAVCTADGGAVGGSERGCSVMGATLRRLPSTSLTTPTGRAWFGGKNVDKRRWNKNRFANELWWKCLGTQVEGFAIYTKLWTCRILQVFVCRGGVFLGILVGVQPIRKILVTLDHFPK